MYARGHNARVDSVYLNPKRQQEFVAKRLDGFKTGRIKPWNKDLSKETDPRVARQAETISKSLRDAHATGELQDWRALDPDKARQAAKQCSKTMLTRFASGELVPWNKGLTKASDVRLSAMSNSLREKLSSDPTTSARRFTSQELIKLIDQVSGGRFIMLSDPKTYRNKYQRMLFKCTVCNEVQEKNLMMLVSSPICFHCHPKESQGQLEVLDFVRSLGVEALSNDRSVITPLELDIWIPASRVAIEYNGLYWHSMACMNDACYHQKKLRACSDVGVRLLSVYEDEWRDHREIIEGMIRHRLGKQIRTFDARKLELRELTRDESKNFFNANHLEGYVRSVTTYGLLDKGSVIAATSLRRPFHKTYADLYELARSCTVRDANVRGWLGRLSKAISSRAKADGKKGIITYVDSRVGPGQGYKNAGWELVASSTGKRFWWTDFVHRYNRFKYRADRSRGMSQGDVANEAGVVEIFGCDNSRWILQTI